MKAIVAPRAGDTLRTLGSLADRELPELDDRLAAGVEFASGFEDLSLRAALLQRYASGAVTARVFAAMGDKLDALACQPKAALLAYFLRVDPQRGEQLLNDALRERLRTGCYQTVLLDVAKLHMSSAIESAAIVHLADPDLALAANAAEVLGQYGSPASVKPLRTAFEQWNAAWSGRAEELRPRFARPSTGINPSMIEYQLLEALGRGRGWLVTGRDLNEFAALCVTDTCMSTVKTMLSQIASGRIDVSVRDGDEAFVSIAQYQLDSLSALDQKLAQYPAGTKFHLSVMAQTPEIASAVRERILRTARAHQVLID